VQAPETETPAQQEENAESAPETVATPQAEPLPPPPRVDNGPSNIAPKSTPPTPQTAPRPMRSLPPPSQPAAAVPPSQVPPAATGKGYVVQLGVFTNPDNARELVEKLNKQGIRAHLEARVQIGPFLNKQEADKAQIEMRKLGYNALVTLPYSAVPSAAASGPARK
jgi:cell division septation protein DedD